jgi:aldehyde dehydrogenase (NAD+)
MRDAEKLAALESTAMGSAIGTQIPLAQMAAGMFKYYAGWADKITGETIPSDDSYKIIKYEPLGACAGVGAWNASFLFFAWKVAPALAAGNTFVYKPSEKSPLGILSLGSLVKEAGFPPGVINIVNGAGKVGALLASHMHIRKISFTGSANVGRKIQMAAAQSNLKRVTLELGGKSPAIIFDDANMENAVAK